MVGDGRLGRDLLYSDYTDQFAPPPDDTGRDEPEAVEHERGLVSL